MRTHHYRLSAALLLLAVPVSPLVADEKAETAARDYAKPRVFQLKTDKGSGTAVLLKLDGQVGYFATCYHVLHGAKEFKIYPSGGKGNLVTDNAKAQILPQRDLDLVLIKAELPKDDTIKPLDPLDANMASHKDEDPIDGFVFGVAGIMSRQMYTSAVRIQQIEWADNLTGVIDLQFTRERRKRQGARLEVRSLGKEMTYAGMSGGLVVDKDRRFAGLLLGRMPEPNAIPLMITARQVKEVLDSAADKWAAFAVLGDLPPYDATVLQRMLEPWPVSEINWNSYDAWVRAFESDPLQFLEAFQEVRLDLTDLRVNARNPKNQTSEQLQVQLNGEQQVQLLVNGISLQAGERIDLQRGENLIILTKPAVSGAGGKFDVTDLMLPNPLDVSLRLGAKGEEETVFQLKRSLPRVIQGYSVYLTIENGPPDPGKGYAARLAVPLDYLEEVINHTPFVLPFGDGDRRSGSEFRGTARPNGERPVKLKYVSPQTLDVSTELGIEVTTAQANFAGVKLMAKPQKATIQMTGRVQFPGSPKSLFFVCARAMAASGADKQFVLPLFGDELTVDASGLLRELLVCYTNTRLLRPNNPRTPGPADLHDFLRSAGLMSDDDAWRLVPARLQLVRDDRPKSEKAWAVVTFQLHHKGKPVAVKNPPPLLPHVKVRDDVAAELVLAEFPPAALAALHPALVAPAGLPPGLVAGDAAPFHIRLALKRPKPVRGKELTLSDSAIELVAQLGKVATAGLGKSQLTAEVSWGGLAVGGLDVKDAQLTLTVTPGAAAPEQIAGTVSLGRAEAKTPFGQAVVKEVQGTFKLAVDPKNREQTYHFRIATTAGKYDLGQNKNQQLPKFDFDVWVSHDGKTVKTNFVDHWLFGKGK
jgi:hypothetical protein